MPEDDLAESESVDFWIEGRWKLIYSLAFD